MTPPRQRECQQSDAEQATKDGHIDQHGLAKLGNGGVEVKRHHHHQRGHIHVLNHHQALDTLELGDIDMAATRLRRGQVRFKRWPTHQTLTDQSAEGHRTENDAALVNQQCLCAGCGAVKLQCPAKEAAIKSSHRHAGKAPVFVHHCA